MAFLLGIVLIFFSFSPVLSGEAVTWASLQPKKITKSKMDVWHIKAVTPTGSTVMYFVQSAPPNIRLFYSHTKYHQSISLLSFGLNKVTDVGVDRSSQQGGAQVLYMGDKATQRVVSLTLGGKDIKEVSLAPGMNTYKDFLAELHPVGQSERHP